MKRGFGCLPAPFEAPHLDALIGLASDDLPASASIQSPFVQPKYQSSTNSCLGQSAAQAYRTTSLAHGIPCPDLSGLWSYKLGRAAMGIEDVDGGMTLSATLAAVQRFGIASEEAWPFRLMKVNARPSPAAFRDAYDRRGLRGIHAIGRDDDVGVRRAIARKYAVIGCFGIDAYFSLDSGPELIDLPIGQIIGYHAMVIEDFASDGSFGLLNHYGDSWRNNGRCRFTRRYVQASVGLAVMDVTALSLP